MPISQMEYRSRANQLLTLDFQEATSRIVGFVEWLETDPAAAAVLDKLRNHDVQALVDAAGFQSPPKPKTPEDVAAIAIVIIDSAVARKTDIFQIGMAIGVRASGSKVQDTSEEISRRYIRPLLQYLQERLFEDESKSPNVKTSTKMETKEVSRCLIFISHSSKDTKLIDAVVDLFCTALNLRRRDIRCTSTAGTMLPGGADTSATLREEIRSVPVFLSILTPASLHSHYVLFELGARWGADMYHVPLLAKGITSEVIKEPLKAINALVLDNIQSVFKLVSEVGAKLGREQETVDAFHDKALRVVQLSKRQKETPPEASRALTDWMATYSSEP